MFLPLNASFLTPSLLLCRSRLLPALHPIPSSWRQTPGGGHLEAEGGAFLRVPLFGPALSAASRRGLLRLALRCQAPGGLDTPPPGERQGVGRGRVAFITIIIIITTIIITIIILIIIIIIIVFLLLDSFLSNKQEKI